MTPPPTLRQSPQVPQLGTADANEDAARSVVIFQTAQPVAEFRGLAHLDHLGVGSL